MIQAVVLAGWVLALGGLVAAAATRRRMMILAEAVARASHELRGPLAAARLGLELSCRGGAVRGARLRALELELARAALALEDLSYVSQRPPPRLGAAVAIQRTEVDIAQLLDDLVEAWREPAIARGIEVRMTGAAPRPVVIGERLRLAQAIGNLIANAVEHGGGAVDVSCYADVAMVRVEVADRGEGLPAHLAELARRRPRLRRTGCGRRQAGSPRGHGLAIASAIATGHGGRLASAPSEHGARLVLELPAARRLELARSAARPSAARPSAARPRTSPSGGGLAS